MLTGSRNMIIISYLRCSNCSMITRCIMQVEGTREVTLSRLRRKRVKQRSHMRLLYVEMKWKWGKFESTCLKYSAFLRCTFATEVPVFSRRQFLYARQEIWVWLASPDRSTFGLDYA